MQEVGNDFGNKGCRYIPEYGFFLRHWAEIDGRVADFVVNRGGRDPGGWTGYVKRHRTNRYRRTMTASSLRRGAEAHHDALI